MLPVVFIIPAAATGIVGAGKTIKSFVDSREADDLTSKANSRVEDAKNHLERSRKLCATSLADYGEEKLFVLNNSIARFVDSFEQIKNLELVDSLGLEELKKLRVDKESMAELKEMREFAAAVAGGLTAGAAGGALTAFGAYNAAMAFASASTGTAISTLSGAAATNATLAFFGGGSLAAGGLGMTGGVMVLGGLVAGPALLVMGLITGKKAEEKLEVAKANSAQADEICQELGNAAFQCDAIRRRTTMFYAFLARLDVRFVPLVDMLEEVLEKEGLGYTGYSQDAKSVVLRSVTMAGTIKSMLDTPILTEDGGLTDESAKLMELLGVRLLEN
ncbi:hypothetical protein [uncultured Adlercreutzia sp.]|uniref:hypothetical protein n=1 Tax=uncultured Adlercreutzia sp. TaxID=875803 RepID=UPI00261F4B0F|nr:hypothetical protein [uncultured Adlercreutzia sp.]MCI9261773.1 hypothetical protein [Eggerthellaceae bacterium]